MHPFTIATGTMHYAQNVLIGIHTDEGLTGWGECSAFPMITGENQDTCLIMAKEFAQIWKGKNPLLIKERMDELHRYAAYNNTIKSAFDMALYDIAAKAQQIPLYRFLGGRPKKVETDLTIGINTAAFMTEQAVEFVKNGVKILKVKLGKNVADDVERIHKIRAAVGNNIEIRIDANQGWSPEDAIEALTRMEVYNIAFCEQPMHRNYDLLLPELIKKSPIKIMADESVFNHYDADRLIQAKACDYINIKFAKSGGLLEAAAIHATAGRAGIRCMMGGMLESRLALTAQLHFVYAAEHIVFYDMDTCMLGHKEDPVIGGVRYNGFCLELDDQPGIGAEVDPAFLEKCDSYVV